MGFREMQIKDLQFNPFTLIDKEWMLITAGKEGHTNTMTASWGGLGELWNHYVSFIFIRPQRYTLEFVEREDFYSLCFFGEEHRATLSYCGSHSGRDVDKIKEAGLTLRQEEAAPYFEEAKLVLICRKLHGQMIDPAGLLDSQIGEKCYPLEDYHKMFIGGIEKILVKE